MVCAYANSSSILIINYNMQSNFDIFAGIDASSNKPQKQADEDFFNLLSSSPKTPATKQPAKKPGQALFEEDDLLDQLQGKPQKQPEHKSTISQQAQIFGEKPKK